MVWRLLKTLYGLKQAPREWNKTLDEHLNKLGYKSLISDPCVYVKKSRNSKLIILSLYVDDTVIAFDVSGISMNGSLTRGDSSLMRIPLRTLVSAIGFLI